MGSLMGTHTGGNHGQASKDRGLILGGPYGPCRESPGAKGTGGNHGQARCGWGAASGSAGTGAYASDEPGMPDVVLAGVRTRDQGHIRGYRRDAEREMARPPRASTRKDLPRGLTCTSVRGE